MLSKEEFISRYNGLFSFVFQNEQEVTDVLSIFRHYGFKWSSDNLSVDERPDANSAIRRHYNIRYIRIGDSSRGAVIYSSYLPSSYHELPASLIIEQFYD